MSKQYFVYILTNYTNAVLYIGVTNDLIKRIWEHKQKFVVGFTGKYHIWKLIYYEVFDDIKNAITREKQIKNWRREKKLTLIKRVNPLFLELNIT